MAPRREHRPRRREQRRLARHRAGHARSAAEVSRRDRVAELRPGRDRGVPAIPSLVGSAGRVPDVRCSTAARWSRRRATTARRTAPGWSMRFPEPGRSAMAAYPASDPLVARGRRHDGQPGSGRPLAQRPLRRRAGLERAHAPFGCAGLRAAARRASVFKAPLWQARYHAKDARSSPTSRTTRRSTAARRHRLLPAEQGRRRRDARPSASTVAQGYTRSAARAPGPRSGRRSSRSRTRCAAARRRPPLGLGGAAALHGRARTSGYASDFHDITTGNNALACGVRSPAPPRSASRRARLRPGDRPRHAERREPARRPRAGATRVRSPATSLTARRATSPTRSSTTTSTPRSTLTPPRSS